MTGVPHANDSMIVRGKPSYQRDGKISASAFPTISNTSAIPRLPRYSTFGSAAAALVTSGRKGPSPRILSRIDLVNPDFHAFKSVEIPFSGDRRPTNTTYRPS